jgi:hypothetical protein
LFEYREQEFPVGIAQRSSLQETGQTLIHISPSNSPIYSREVIHTGDPLPIARQYRIVTPTIAVFSCDGATRTVTVPVNEIVSVSECLRGADRLIDVMWKEQVHQMFTQDLRERGEEV